jgi:hypothetical protein
LYNKELEKSASPEAPASRPLPKGLPTALEEGFKYANVVNHIRRPRLKLSSEVEKVKEGRGEGR